MYSGKRQMLRLSNIAGQLFFHRSFKRRGQAKEAKRFVEAAGIKTLREEAESSSRMSRAIRETFGGPCTTSGAGHPRPCWPACNWSRRSGASRSDRRRRLRYPPSERWSAAH